MSRYDDRSPPRDRERERERDRGRDDDRRGNGGGGRGPPRDRGDGEGKRVFVGGLDPKTTKADLENFFRGYGTFSVWVARSPPGFGFVEFDDTRDAADACKALDGKEIDGKPIRVELSTGRGRRSGGPRDDKCYECGQPGHIARDCRDRGGGGRRRSPSPRRRSPSPRRRSPSPRRRSPSPRRERVRSPRRDRSPVRA